jgi:hypothetical protein
MGLWFFLSEWFGDVSTAGTLFKRSAINGALAIGLIFVLMLFQVPAEYAAIVFFGLFALNGLMAFFYLQQR